MPFGAIAWQRPWLAMLRELGEPLAQQNDWIAVATELARERGLSNLNGQPIRFIPQHHLPAGTPYEAHIAATGEVPTRDNLHDFFNMLAWLHMPAIKRELNALHARALLLPAAAGTRGGQRDAATLFDENAAFFVSSDAARLQALREHDWSSVLFRSADAFLADSDVLLFGHALIEQLVRPYKAITAHVWTVQVGSHWFELSAAQRMRDLDGRIATQLRAGFRSADFCHLPVLGVPGWWPGQDRAFYQDAAVFRPKRRVALVKSVDAAARHDRA